MAFRALGFGGFMMIRTMTKQDTEEVYRMMRVFYDSPAVLHTAPDSILLQDIADCTGECPFIEGYVFEEDGQISGYAMAAKSYSTEYGGLCIWVEDIYIKPAFQGRGMGKAFLDYLEERYRGQAVRFRLEAEDENEHAIRLYRKQGYQKLPYVQMTKEV